MNDTVDDVLGASQGAALQIVTSACEKASRSQWKRVVGDASKRAFDLTVALTGIIILSPLIASLALLLLVLQGGPVFIAHQRVGRHGRPFRCLKFRSMVVDADRVLATHLADSPPAAIEWETTRKLRNDPRVTPIGSALRKTSVDEIPQLINIVRGEMSLVGPRPIVESERICYGALIDRYLSTRPGLTGLWQVSGRSDTDYPRRVQLDADYVGSRTFLGDLWIIVKTVPAVIRSKGAL